MTKIQKENKSMGNVPNLRFKEFQGEWERKKLKDMIDIKAGYAFPSNNMLTEKSTYQLIKMSNVYQSELRLDRNPSFWQTIDSKQKEFLLNKGDTILTLTGTVGKQDFGYSAQIDEDDKYLLNQRLVVLRYVKDKSTSDFIKQLVANKKFLFDFFGVAKGGTGNQANVGIDDLKSIIFTFPSIREQQKIASFLSLIDERITTQNKIIENLKTQILGLQEKIFRQKIKLKDDNNKEFPSWDYKNGGELFESISNKNHNSDLPILAITQEQGAVPRDLIDYQITVTDRSIETYKVVDIGDFIISLRSFQGGLEYSNYKDICSPAYIILKSKVEIEPNFYKYYFKTSDYIKLLNKKLEGIRDGKMISYTYFSEISVPFPPLKEQKQIASFLSLIDHKIQTEKQILGQLEKQKKYLLQQMFI